MPAAFASRHRDALTCRGAGVAADGARQATARSFPRRQLGQRTLSRTVRQAMAPPDADEVAPL